MCERVVCERVVCVHRCTITLLRILRNSNFHVRNCWPLLATGYMLLLIVDAHLKWIEAEMVQHATSGGTIQKL